MPIQRYTSVIALGTRFGTSRSHVTIRQAIVDGILSHKPMVLKGFERLDTIAGKFYGDSSLWWVIAAASNIGWGLQVPPGTIINIPDLTQVQSLLG